MIERYRYVGHMFSKVDPLDLPKESFIGAVSKDVISHSAFGLSDEDMKREFNHQSARSEGINMEKINAQMMEDYLQGVYCREVGYEYMHLLSKEERDFIKYMVETNIESLDVEPLTKA